MMMSFVIAFRFCVTAFIFGYFIHGVKSKYENETESVGVRIFGGVAVTIDQLPYMVSIIREGRHDCGGSIINNQYVLTAAHCLHPDSHYVIRAGTDVWSIGGVNHSVIDYIVHPKFIKSNIKNYDIGVMKVDPPFIFTETVQPIRLATRGEYVLPGTQVIVSGWGAIALAPVRMAQNLQVVELYTISNAECAQYYPGEITSQMLCAGFIGAERDSCFGDSGGPLVAVATMVQVGVVSWGPDGLCASPVQPFAVYSNVAELHDWISQQTGV